MPATFEDSVPTARKGNRLSRRPLAPGTWVTGHNAAGNAFSNTHRSCVFEILDAAEREPLSSGTVQAVVCVIDGEKFDTVDTSFLREPVTAEQLRKLEKYVRSMRQLLKASHMRITRKLADV